MHQERRVHAPGNRAATCHGADLPGMRLTRRKIMSQKKPGVVVAGTLSQGPSPSFETEAIVPAWALGRTAAEHPPLGAGEEAYGRHLRAAPRRVRSRTAARPAAGQHGARGWGRDRTPGPRPAAGDRHRAHGERAPCVRCPRPARRGTRRMRRAPRRTNAPAPLGACELQDRRHRQPLLGRTEGVDRIVPANRP